MRHKGADFFFGGSCSYCGDSVAAATIIERPTLRDEGFLLDAAPATNLASVVVSTVEDRVHPN